MKRLVLWWMLALTGMAWAEPQEAQPSLPTIQLTVKGKKITAEVADDTQERTAGLMFRKELAADSGMLFVMPQQTQAVFWMKNTLIPLSVAYISASGIILEIHALKPKDETPVPSVFQSIAFALEMEQGWFEKNGISPGDKLKGLPPSL